MYTGKPPRLQSFDYLGLHRDSLTFCTDHRRHVFISQAAVTLVLSQISRAAAEQKFAVIAYCFMPDHLHLLVAGQSETSDCKHFIARAKQYSGYSYSKQFGSRLWQRYGFEHVLRDEELTPVVARYLLGNPTALGLPSKCWTIRSSGRLCTT